MDELNEALLELRNAVVDLKMVTLDTNHKMSEAANDSHLKSALTMLDNNFYFRNLLDNSNHPRRHKQDTNYF